MNEIELGRIIGKLEGRVERLENMVADVVGMLNNLQQRIQLLENEKKG